jgi:hypothetical protein
MKKVFSVLFDGKWGSLALMQGLFFGGLWLGSGEVGSIAGLVAGLVWFGSFVVWIFGQKK